MGTCHDNPAVWTFLLLNPTVTMRPQNGFYSYLKLPRNGIISFLKFGLVTALTLDCNIYWKQFFRKKID